MMKDDLPSSASAPERFTSLVNGIGGQHRVAVGRLQRRGTEAESSQLCFAISSDQQLSSARRNAHDVHVYI